ncbi:MAG: SIS domain-containing protein [Planctomycetota bacterium]
MDFETLSRSVLADVARCVQSVDAHQVRVFVDAIASKRRLFLIGSGRSGAMLEAMAVRLGHLDVAAHVAGKPDCPEIKHGDLVLVGSGSGRTPVPLERAIAARRAGAAITLITTNPVSPIAKMAKIVIHVPAAEAPAGSSHHTLRSLFEESLLIICDCACRMLQHKLGFSTEDMQERHSTVE